MKRNLDDNYYIIIIGIDGDDDIKEEVGRQDYDNNGHEEREENSDARNEEIQKMEFMEIEEIDNEEEIDT